MQAYLLGGAFLATSTVDLYQLKGNIDQVHHPTVPPALRPNTVLQRLDEVKAICRCIHTD